MRSMWIRCVDYQRSRHRYLHAYSKEVDIYEEEVYYFSLSLPPFEKSLSLFPRFLAHPQRYKPSTHRERDAFAHSPRSIQQWSSL